MLTAPYGGKLIRYLVPDGAHLGKNDAYAEVEVMKMLFVLAVSNGRLPQPRARQRDGRRRREIGNLSLDDPTLVAKASPFVDGSATSASSRWRSARGGCRCNSRASQRVHHILDECVDDEAVLLAITRYSSASTDGARMNG